MGWRPIITQAIALISLIACSYQPSRKTNQITPTYDDKTGKLTLLEYDSNGNGRVDTWSYMDGVRVVRIEIDQDEDGRVDRWEYYDANQKIERVGFSRLGDGKEDAWSFAGPDGSIARIEVRAKREGRISRIEHYDKGQMTSAEEDTDGDGKMDKWETYDGIRLAMVAYDTQHRGRADRRLVYAAGGAVRVEIDARGDGVFITEPAAK